LTSLLLSRPGASVLVRGRIARSRPGSHRPVGQPPAPTGSHRPVGQPPAPDRTAPLT